MVGAAARGEGGAGTGGDFGGAGGVEMAGGGGEALPGKSSPPQLEVGLRVDFGATEVRVLSAAGVPHCGHKNAPAESWAPQPPHLVVTRAAP